jgi:FkbM family methyltransferase
MKTIDSYIDSPLPIKGELGVLLKNTKNPVILDIGACECEDSIRYSLLFPNATIYSFEPLKKNFERCEKNVIKYNRQNIKIFNLALSNSEGEEKFYLSSGRPEGVEVSEWDYGNKSSSLLKPNLEAIQKWLKFEESTTVVATTLDKFCKKNNISHIDFIHMDVQGAELLVLEGAHEILPKIKSIWLEVSQHEFYESQPLKTDIEKFMNSNNFFRVRDTEDLMGDQLYVNKNYFHEYTLKLRLFFHKLFNK